MVSLNWSKFASFLINNNTIMRTNVAVIKLVLRTNKTLSTGEHPIMLRCSWKGMKEVSTGYSCLVRYWSVKDERIKKGYPNYLMINSYIQGLKNNAIALRDKYIASQTVYTPSMILCPPDENKTIVGDLYSLIQRYIDERGLQSRTIEKWWIVYRSLKRYTDRELIINELNESFCRGYCLWLEENGLSSGSIRSYFGKVVCLLHYAVSLGLLNDYPLKGFAYHKRYRECKSELYIHSSSMDVMIEMFLDRIINRIANGKYSFKDDMVNKLMDIHSYEYGVYLYIIGYVMGGIAPVDISLLKREDIKMMVIKGIGCYGIDGMRSKTGMVYKLRLRRDDIINRVLIDIMLLFNTGEYFLPTLNGFSGNIKKRVNNIYCYHSSHLVDWFKEVNGEIVKRNVENGCDIPLIDLDCRYYSYRHSRIMAEIQRPNVNLLRIATMTGKSIKTLHQYISLLGDEDLI